MVDDTEERNNIIKQIKEVLGKINMNLKEILKASQARNKARLAELQGKVEKGEVRSEELAAVKAEVEALTEEAKTLADEIAKLEEEEKKKIQTKRKMMIQRKRRSSQKKTRILKRNFQKNNVPLFQHLSQPPFLLKVINLLKQRKGNSFSFCELHCR